jgi:hypothetical protein
MNGSSSRHGVNEIELTLNAKLPPSVSRQTGPSLFLPPPVGLLYQG